MKLNYKLKVCLMVLAFSFIGSTTIATNTFETKITANNSDNWELVEEVNGIKAYIKEYVNIDGTLALKIKFENTTNQEVELNWLLINKMSKKSLAKNNSMIGANETLVFMNEENPIPVNYGETINHLSIIFK